MTNEQYFLVRRLHSLLGVVPLGVFLFAHMTTNSMAFFSREAFDDKVDLIHSLGPLLPIVEAVVIMIPLALHIVIGIAIAVTARNESHLHYPRNWAYKMQRWSGWAALAFIVYHVVALRFLDLAGGKENFYPYMAELFQNPLWIAIYFLGGVAVIYHFANGLCTFCMTWGITVGPRSQRVMAGIATAAGIVLLGMLVSSIVGFHLGYEEAMAESTAAMYAE